MRWLALLLLLPAGAWAQTFSMPTTAEHAPHFYPTAYRDHGGQDWACGSIYYSGHRGTDIGVGGFAGMDAGRDLVAVADGTVDYVIDGFFDRCTSGGCPGGGGFGNYVRILHADGTHTYYGHMRQWSISVATGDSVTCGQVIGQVGSSGNSTGPHLHFEPRTSGTSFDPFAGSCASGTTKWTQQGTHGGLPGVTCAGVSIEPIVVDDEDPEFAFIDGSDPDQPDLATGGWDGSFHYGEPFSVQTPLVTAAWTPVIPQTGLYQVEAWIPDSPAAAATAAPFNIAFQGGHALWMVDQSTHTDDWEPLFPDQPFKFLEGEINRVTLRNLTAEQAENTVAWDALRFSYQGPAGNTPVGGSCNLANDCDGALICIDAACAPPCTSAGCAVGTCEAASGVCVEGDPNDPELIEEGEFPWFNPDPSQDTDGDGIPDYLEGPGDSDGDAFPDFLDLDSDNDGIDDADEADGDYDHDGIPNYLDEDSDGDGISDADEAPGGVSVDSDGDGQPDFLDSDSDNDGIGDADEVGHPEEPVDTDGDGTPDYLDSDSDNDGIPDADEVGEDPSNPPDTDGDGVPDHLDTDSDDDGLTDAWEGNDDSDGDGVPDFQDTDSDNDGIPDAEDPDSDGDGVDDLTTSGPPSFGDDSGCGCYQQLSALDRRGAALALLFLLPAGLRRRR